MMNRELQIVQYASPLRGRPFAWGETDCASICIGAINRLAGRDLITDHWSDEAEARARIGQSLPSVVLAAAGLESIEPGAATIGDVLIVPDKDWPESLYLCLGGRSMSAIQSDGVIMVPTRSVVTNAISAWRLP